jgi:hypothetical protein
MLRISMDTNCIIYHINEINPAVSKLLSYASQGKVNIAVTSRVPFELRGYEDEEKVEHDLEIFDQLPILQIPAPFRLDYTGLDQDRLACRELEAKVGKTLFPDPRSKVDVRDIDHLMGHIYDRGDIYVTSNLKHFDPDRCKRELKVTVMRPEEVITLIESSE